MRNAEWQVGLVAPPRVELPRKWIVLAVLLTAPFLAVLDGFIVTIAAPSIQDQLHATDAGVQLVVAGYVRAYPALLLARGRARGSLGPPEAPPARPVPSFAPAPPPA